MSSSLYVCNLPLKVVEEEQEEEVAARKKTSLSVSAKTAVHNLGQQYPCQD